MVFNATFNNISVTLYIVEVSFIGGRHQSTRCLVFIWKVLTCNLFICM